VALGQVTQHGVGPHLGPGIQRIGQDLGQQENVQI